MRKISLGAAALLCSVSAQAADLKTEIAQARPVAEETYRFLHSNPELGKKEVKAHDYLVAKLRSLGFTQFLPSRSAPTAVIAVFDSGRPGRTIALRAEMDARPLPAGTMEPAEHMPRSATPGIMHNCGHDVHAAVLLATAALVRANAVRFAGRIVFLFQPAEEVAGGADDIVKDGILTKLGVERIFALHSAPGMPVGTVGLSPGAILAGSNYFSLALTGRGSHAAAPQDGDDVLLGAMRVAQDLSFVPARGLDIAERPVVVSITGFTGDSGATNVLPGSVEMKGTVRAFELLDHSDLGTRSLRDVLTQRVQASSAANGLTARWELRAGSPPTRNDPDLFAALAPSLARAFSGKLDTAPHRGMFSEDFAYYTPVVPALYASLGVAKDGLGEGGVHSAAFTVHPDSLSVGIELMARFAEFGTRDRIAWN